GSNAVTTVLIVLGILVVINFLASRYSHRFDTTEGRVHSLSDQTVTLLDSLKKDVHVVAFYRGHNQERFGSLLKEYAYHSRHFSYRLVDPDKEPMVAREYRIATYGTSVIQVGEKQEQIRSSTEKDLTNAVVKALRSEEKVIYFAFGHGEATPEDLDRRGYSRVKQALLEANYVLRDSLLIVQEGMIPGDCDLLIVAGPTSALLPAEIDSVRSYLERGGSGLFLLDPGVESGMEAMLEEWGVNVNDDYVVDRRGLHYSTPVSAGYGSHAVTAKHRATMTFYPLARSVSQKLPVPGVEEAVELVFTSRDSWSESDRLSDQVPSFDSATDRPGPVPLAVAVTAKPKAPRSEAGEDVEAKVRIVVFGDADFASNQFFGAAGNGDLFLNSVNWLLEEGQLIAIRPRERGLRPMTLTGNDTRWIFWFSLVLLPGVPVIAGVLVWWRRR
ncbi:MAG: GldG family protein, partial [Candidatus Latescibacteria bacterium]|nr:GldG family protein [Candidatus Latescibacterota bacterium]